MTPPPTSFGVGVVLDKRYRMVEALGQGGMGAVWIAEHAELGRRVAIKVLQKQIGSDPEMRQRFDREAHTLAAMAHPNVVALNDYGVWAGNPYLVMELLEGRTLRDLLDAEGTLPFPRARGVAQQILRALAYAHGRGVIHRDLKPGNVFLQALPDEVDHVKLLDFGFAKFVNQAAGAFVSKDGIAVGTPAYMAPEQGGGAVDERADLYGVGVLLFEMLAGRRPFEGEPIEMIRARMARDAPKLGDVRPGAAATPALDAFLARALTKDPKDRFASASEMSGALAALSERAFDAGTSKSTTPRQKSEPSPPTQRLDSGELARVTLMPPWRRAVIAGGVLGALVTVWALVMGVTGWAFDPTTAPLFALVVPFEIVVLAVLLRATASENAFRAQLGTGTVAALTAAPIVFAQSLVFTGVLYADWFVAHPESGTPLAQALAGVVGTITTGVVASALIGAFVRKKR